MANLEKFELETTTTKENGLVIAGGFENTLKNVSEILSQYPATVINNDVDKKAAKEIRTALNKCRDAVNRRRIDSIEDFTKDFNEQCKHIADLFDARAKDIGVQIKAYEDAHKEVVGTTTIAKKTLTVKTTNEKLISKITKLCEEYGAELTIK